MTRTLVALAAASTLTLSIALAQTGMNPPGTPAPGMSGDMEKPALNKSDVNKTDSGKPDKAATGASKIVDAQKPDEWLASRFRGTEVLGTDGAKVGSVADILFDRNGMIKAIVIGVGGFLGIGAKDVAIDFKEFQIVPGRDGGADQLKLATSRDQLDATVEFKPYEPPRPTVSTVPGGGTGSTRRPLAPSQQ
jgi:sporulation protein YlmC with PRC-barrel domain